jgi:hypothetical protein
LTSNLKFSLEAVINTQNLGSNTLTEPELALEGKTYSQIENVDFLKKSISLLIALWKDIFLVYWELG